MSKIYRVADVNAAPAWFNGKARFNGAIEPQEAQGIINAPDNLTEEGVVGEMDKIEQCANTKQTYHYSSRWPASVTSELLEYASINNVPAVAIDPQNQNLQQYAAQTGLQKSASTLNVALPKNPVDELIGDPFHLDEKGDMSHMDKDNWERVRPETKAQHPQVMMSSAGILNIGGAGESTQARLVQKVPGQNSMLSPNAIGELAEKQADDISARLRQETKDRSQKRLEANRVRDLEQVQKAEASNAEIPGALCRGRVMASDARESSGGFTGGHIPAKQSMPDLTAGEMIRQKNIEAKAAIQRKKEQDRSWDQVQGAGRHLIDETFIAAIKKQLGEK